MPDDGYRTITVQYTNNCRMCGERIVVGSRALFHIATRRLECYGGCGQQRVGERQWQVVAPAPAPTPQPVSNGSSWVPTLDDLVTMTPAQIEARRAPPRCVRCGSHAVTLEHPRHCVPCWNTSDNDVQRFAGAGAQTDVVASIAEAQRKEKLRVQQAQQEAELRAREAAQREVDAENQRQRDLAARVAANRVAQAEAAFREQNRLANEAHAREIAAADALLLRRPPTAPTPAPKPAPEPEKKRDRFELIELD